jgi:hypothetical protein
MARPGLTQHRKFARLARAVGDEAIALGCLEFVWEVCYQNGDDYLGDELDVELAAHWRGEAGKLFRALLDAGGEGNSGFIDELEERPGHYRVHDLFDHAPTYVFRRLRREIERRANGVTLSEVRAAAGRKGAEITNGKRRQTGDKQVAPAWQLAATPAPAPAPAQESQILSCDASEKSAAAPRGNGTGTFEQATAANGKIKSTPSTKKKPKPEKQTDQRYTPTRELLAVAFSESCSKTEPPPWDGHSGKELRDWLASHTLGLPAIDALIRNAACSENASELLRDPARLIPHLRRYHAPLDRYGFAATSQQTDGPKVGVHQATPPEAPRKVRVPLGLNRKSGEKRWDGFLESMLQRKGQDVCDTWFKPTHALGIGRGVLHVTVPTADFSSHISKKYAPELKEFLPDLHVNFCVPEEVSHV